MIHKLKLKELAAKLKSDLKRMDLRDPKTLGAVATFLAVPLVVGALAFSLGKALTTNDIGNSAVMVTNGQMTSGGTGVILKSTDSESTIITNKHVCGVVKAGGVIGHRGDVYQVTAYLESEKSDLCLIKVSDDLGVNTKVSTTGPKFYDKAAISGHPALMPNVITEGHVSGRAIIQVLTEIRACTPEEANDETLGIICVLAGGMPVVKSFESVLVTATIMPGSSGSGVYNANKELEGLVFAGSGGIGYAWTVPYEQVVNFINNDAPKAQFTLVKNEMSIAEKIAGGGKRMRDLKEKCLKQTIKNETMEKICTALERNIIWSK